jgi:hypothetical protein
VNRWKRTSVVHSKEQVVRSSEERQRDLKNPDNCYLIEEHSQKQLGRRREEDNPPNLPWKKSRDPEELKIWS